MQDIRSKVVKSICHLEDSEMALLKKAQIFSDFDVFFKFARRSKMLKKGGTLIVQIQEEVTRVKYMALDRLDSKISSESRKILRKLKKELDRVAESTKLCN